MTASLSPKGELQLEPTALSLCSDDSYSSVAQAAINSLSYGGLFSLEFIRELIAAPGGTPPEEPKSLLQIYAEVCADPHFKPVPYDPDHLISTRVKYVVDGENSGKLREMFKSWSLSDEEVGDGPKGWRRKVAEVDLLASLLACGTTRRGYEKKVDFFLVSHKAMSTVVAVVGAELD